MTALAYTSGTAIRVRMAGGTADQAIFDAIGSAVNEIVEGYIGAPIGPAGTAARTYDGDGGHTLYVRQGIAGTAITLEVADQTGGTFRTLATTEYVLRPAAHDRPTGFPARKVCLTPSATSNFTYGYDTVRVTPDASGFGWPAIPLDVSLIAVILGTRLYQSRQSGEAMVIGSPEFGAAALGMLERDEVAVLDRYRYVVGSPIG